MGTENGHEDGWIGTEVILASVAASAFRVRNMKDSDCFHDDEVRMKCIGKHDADNAEDTVVNASYCMNPEEPVYIDSGRAQHIVATSGGLDVPAAALTT